MIEKIKVFVSAQWQRIKSFVAMVWSHVHGIVDDGFKVVRNAIGTPHGIIELVLLGGIALALLKTGTGIIENVLDIVKVIGENWRGGIIVAVLVLGLFIVHKIAPTIDKKL